MLARPEDVIQWRAYEDAVGAHRARIARRGVPAHGLPPPDVFTPSPRAAGRPRSPPAAIIRYPGETHVLPPP